MIHVCNIWRGSVAKNVTSLQKQEGKTMQYEVVGGNLPVVKIALDAGDAVQCESGAMSWMDDGIKM